MLACTQALPFQAMKPKEHPPEIGPWQWEFPIPVTLYLDDLAAIWSLLAKLGGSVAAESDGYAEIESLDELRSLHGKPMRWLKITASLASGNFEAHLGPGLARLVMFSPSLEYVGIDAQIRPILLRRWHNASSDLGWLLGFLLLVAGGFVAATNTNTLPLVLIGLLVGVLGPIVWWSLRHWKEPAVLLPMIEYDERPPGFLRRRRDEVVLGLFFLALGWLLGQWTPFHLGS